MPHRVVFTSFHGRGYRGNPRMLAEAMLDDPRFEVHWVATRDDVVERARERLGAERVHHVHSWRGLQAVASAGVVVLSHGLSDLGGVRPPSRAVVLQTWHGLPTKRGNLMGTPSVREWLRTRRQWGCVDYMLSSGPLVSNIYRRRFGLCASQLLEIGYPTYDRLVDVAPLDVAAAFPSAPPHERVVVYAPTFRTCAATRFFPFFDLDVEQLARALDDLRALVLLRPHPNDTVDLSRWLRASPRFQLATSERIEDPFALLCRADAVVTDYSGIYLEALLADTPPIFVPYDQLDYERGFPYDYESMTPGPKPLTQAAFVQALKLAFERPCHGRIERERVRQQFFATRDGGATARVVEWLAGTCRQLARGAA